MIPTEIVDFLFEVLYSDGTPQSIKKQAHELISYHKLVMGEINQSPKTHRTHIQINHAGVGYAIPKEVHDDIAALINRGQKIEAIKELRSYMTMESAPNGLKECKDTVEFSDNWAPF